MGLASSLFGSPVSILFLSLSLTLFFRLIPWSTGSRCVHFSAWASKTHTRGSPRWGTLHYSSGRLWPYVDGVSLLSEALLAFYVNQRIEPLSLLYSLNCKLFPYLSLNLYISLATPSPLRITLDPLGLDPGIVPCPVLTVAS